MRTQDETAADKVLSGASPEVVEGGASFVSPEVVGDVAPAKSANLAESHFLAIVSRMRYIGRWQLMRNSRPENLSEHSLDVAMIAHLLCVIANTRYGQQLDAERAALIGMYHDVSEIITGDMPTPVKYHDADIRTAYKDVERSAVERLLSTLPADLQPTYRGVLAPDTCGNGELDGTARAGAAAGVEGATNAGVEGAPAESEPDPATQRMLRLVKAADKLSAYIKCAEEESSGNTEFRSARATTRAMLDQMAAELPEVADFMRDFLPSYGSTLDELLG